MAPSSVEGFVTMLLLKSYLHSDSNLGLQIRFDVAGDLWQVQLVSLPDRPKDVTEDTPPSPVTQLAGAESEDLICALRAVSADYGLGIAKALAEVEAAIRKGNGKA